MKSTDPGLAPQKTLPVSVYREIHRHAKQDRCNAILSSTIADLLTIAFFFCMRSCEYSTVTGDKKTKLLCFCNLRLHDKITNPSLTIHHGYNKPSQYPLHLNSRKKKRYKMTQLLTNAPMTPSTAGTCAP
jgi:hypothetical protein